MYRDISHLILYNVICRDCLVEKVARVILELEVPGFDRNDLIRRMNEAIKDLLDAADEYGFDEDLWQSYLTWLILMSDNAFSRASERRSVPVDASVSQIALRECEHLQKLFHPDFSLPQASLGLSALETVLSYSSAAPLIGDHSVFAAYEAGEAVRDLRRKLDAASDGSMFFHTLSDYYSHYGFGVFAMYRAFRVDTKGQDLELLPVRGFERVTLSDLVGYESQKAELRANTSAFIEGRMANNVLLYGDAGTGKSTSIKALANEYYGDGLRLIEIHKHQFEYLSELIRHLRMRNYRFIIFIDDLSFEEDETGYKFLKSVIEGGLEAKPENVLIYATSNRRHLVREVWKDRDDMEHNKDVHRSDTIEEKTSLAARFGLSINFSAPTPKEYHRIVAELAKKYGIEMDTEELRTMANTWEIRHGGFSGRAARQFIQYLDSQKR